jgi:translocation and assembly module TamA
MKFFIYLLLILTLPLAAKVEVCSKVIVHGDNDLKFTDTERRLVCGDSKVEAYREIPGYEAQYFMTGFLQSRSYLNPRFEMNGEVLNVYVGEKAILTEIEIIYPEGEEKEEIYSELRRLYLRKLLNPSLISEVESAALSLLRQRGHACAKVESEVDASTYKIRLRFLRTKKFPFGDFEKEKIKGLFDNALARYYPFRFDDKFNEKLLKLTEKRMVRAEVVQGTYFLENCSLDGEDFTLSEKFLVGPPRTLRFGVGASTELGPMARVRWSNNRAGPLASIYSARVQGSLRSQSLILTADSFFWKNLPRRSILSQLEITRDSQIDYEQLLTKFGPVTTKWTRDLGGHLQTYTLGPSFESGTYHSKINSDTKSFKTGVIEGSFQWMAHDYEYYDINPEDGDHLRFNFGFRHPQLGFSDPSLKLDSTYVKLSRLSSWGRGLLVGGFRLGLGTTWISRSVDPASLPPQVKFFGGGSDDLRGYLLNTLPRGDGAGALTKILLKLEARRTYLFVPGLEGFAFVDNGYFGTKSFSTAPQLFYSPGVGVRWDSPIGLVQSYVARALTLAPGEDHGNFYYVGLGGLF